jgi:hypothetical protein
MPRESTLLRDRDHWTSGVLGPVDELTRGRQRLVIFGPDRRKLALSGLA